MSKIVLEDTISGHALQVINDNFTKVETALNEDVLYRDNPVGETNTMLSVLDMNGQRLINLPAPGSLNDAARMQDVVDSMAGITNAAAIPFTPTGTIGSTNVQGAVAETAAEAEALYTSLKADLIDTTSALKGAALVKYSPSLPYADNTVGKFINHREFYATAYGAKFDGATNDTAAINAAMDAAEAAGGGKVLLPRGTALVDILRLRAFVDLEGASMDGTVLQSANINTAMFAIKAGAVTYEAASIGMFTIKAHASGSISAAAFCAGGRDALWHNIEYRSNGSGRYTTVFNIAAHPNPTYNIGFYRIRCNNQNPGPVELFTFDNNGQGSAYNTNNGYISHLWVVDNVGVARIIGGARSANFQLSNSLIEGNPGTIAVEPGQAWTIGPTNWFETNGEDIKYTNPESGSAGNYGTVIGNYFTNPHNVDMSLVHGNMWINNKEAGAQTWINNTSKLNIKLDIPETLPTAPTLSRTSGTTGTLTLVSSTVNLIKTDGAVFALQYSWTPTTATGNTELTIGTVSGHTLENVEAYMLRGSSGEPRPIARTLDNKLWVNNAYSDVHNIYVTLKYSR